MKDITIIQAAVYGTQAFKEGKPKIPSRDANLMGLIREHSTGMGSCLPLLKVWSQAWLAARSWRQAAATAPDHLEFHAAVITWDGDSEMLIDVSEAVLESKLAAWCAARWQELEGQCGPVPLDNRTAYQTFFEEHPWKTLYFQKGRLPVADTD